MTNTGTPDRITIIAYRLAADAINDVGADLHAYTDGLDDEEYNFVMAHRAEIAAALHGISNDLLNKARHPEVIA